jgi:hypothetical protein
VFWSYSRSVPGTNHLWGTSLGRSADTWASQETASEDVAAYTFAEWCRNVGQKFLEFYSPFVLVAVPGLLYTGVRALRTRANDPAQHVLMLWLWIVPYCVAFSRAFYAHIHYHVLFLAAVAVTLGLLADTAYGWLMSRSRAVGGVLSVGVCLSLMMWTQHVMGRDDPATALRARRVEWAADLARETAPDQRSAFVLHYAFPMRFLADRAVFEGIDSLGKLEALAKSPDQPDALLVPVEYPFADQALAKHLLIRLNPPVAGTSTLLFSLKPARGDALLHFLGPEGPVDLGKGFSVRDFETCWFAVEGRRFVYVGAALAAPRVAERGESLEWEVQFTGKEGRAVGSTRMPAAASAAYFLEVPADADQGEMALCRRSPGRAQGGLASRLAGHVLRIVTFDTVGRLDDRVERLLVDGRRPLVLQGRR